MIELEKLNEFTESHGALRTGKGLVSGVIALTLAILCFLGVLAFHFPEYLTTPQLRKSYDVTVIRNIMLVAMASMPGSMDTITGMGTGMGMAGLASGLIEMPLKSLRSNCRP